MRMIDQLHGQNIKFHVSRLLAAAPMMPSRNRTGAIMVSLQARHFA